MDRNREHLELPRGHQPLPRRKRAGRSLQRQDKTLHGRELFKQANKVANQLRQRMETAPKGINPKLVFKLVLHPKGNLDDQQLQHLGLQVLGIDSQKALVVFPDQATLDELRRRLSEYAGLTQDGHQYAYLASVEALEELTPEDRTGPLLAKTPLDDDEVAALDVELWHTGDVEECRRNVQEIEAYLDGLSRRDTSSARLQVTDDYIGSSLCVLRARLNRTALYELLSGERFDYVKEIERRPEPTFDLGDVIRIGLVEIEVSHTTPDSPDDLIGIVVVDSGVAQQHPLLAPALGDAQVFPDRLLERIHGGPEDGDQRGQGHGTAVAGIAVYGDVGASIQTRRFVPSARLFSARVTDDNNEYDPDELLEHQLDQAITYFLENYPEARVVNISLGNRLAVYSDERYQFRLASLIDDIAYRYRDKEIVFVVSAGNYFHDCNDDEDILQNYPGYLLQSSKARIIDPATSAIALTVGGLSYGSRGDYGLSTELTDRLIAGQRDWPSPFTRTGWGFGGAIKPELVDYAGDLRFSRGRVPEWPTYAGLPSMARNFGPPEGRLFRTVAGTSFAAPRVANLASRLIREFPNASSNLIRALILDSARIPSSRPPGFDGLDMSSDDILRIYGYGQPDFERARWSANSDVLLLADSVMGLDTFELFVIPPLPDVFFESRGAGYLSVSLAFDPPTRHTRADSYLGVAMQFDLFRNVSIEMVADALRAWDNSERESLEDLDLPSLGRLQSDTGYSTRSNLKPKTGRRSQGTAQRAVLKVAGSAWHYDGEPLILAVICQRKWAPRDVVEQRFAAVVSLYHENPDIDLYSHVQQQARQYQRERIRI